MASGITVRGVDLDNVYSGKGSATASATGVTIGGVDLNQRYLALSQGVAQPNQGVVSHGSDFSAYFGKVGALSIPFGSYSAFSQDSHDCGAGFTLSMFNDGTWSISMYALHGGTTSGSPLSGTWVSNPGAGIGSSYEMLLDSSHMGISNNYTPPDQVSPTFTASHTWQSLGGSSPLIVNADTSHMIAGGAGSGSIFVQGYFLIYVRPNGSGSGVLSTLQVSVEGDAL